LTDFEEFRVYLGRGKEPKGDDQINTAWVSALSCRYTDYLDRWDDIWRYFPRESVIKGSLETIPAVKKNAKGDVTVDALFYPILKSGVKTSLKISASITPICLPACLMNWCKKPSTG